MITIHIPKNSERIDLQNELTSARNIQDKKVRENTLTGLKIIAKYL